MVVFVDYGRAPEHRYPVAIEQAYAATCYVSEHAEEFGVDATRLAVLAIAQAATWPQSCRYLQSNSLVPQ